MPSINDILANEDFGQVVSTLCVDTIEYREPREYYREYHGERRRRKTSVGWREPKRLAVYSETLKDKNDRRCSTYRYQLPEKGGAYLCRFLVWRANDDYGN